MTIEYYDVSLLHRVVANNFRVRQPDMGKSALHVLPHLVLTAPLWMSAIIIAIIQKRKGYENLNL